MKHTAFFILCLFLGNIAPTTGQAQNPYDFCESAYKIENPKKWCSNNEQFTTFEATNSGSDIATCFANFGKDVWFKFTAVGTVLKITVKGVGKTKEIMKQPEFVLFSGDCNNQINLIGCTRSRKGKRFTALRKEDIIPGQTYLVNVQDANEEAGNFQICIRNYSPKVLTKTQSKEKKYIPELSKPLKNGVEFAIKKMNFDANSFEIKSSFIPILFEIVKFLKENPSVVVEIGGHTNSRCDDEYCMKLSLNRAKAIAEFITDKEVLTQQIAFKGYGKSRPLSRSSSRQANNQRVAIKILKTR